MTATERLARILFDLNARSRAAAARNKVTLWAYYGTMCAGLATLILSGTRDDAEIQSRAVALVERADRECATLPMDGAATLWALSIYCARIAGIRRRRSLAWLRERTGTRRPDAPALMVSP